MSAVIKIGDRVKFSTAWLRSTGATGWRSEVKGTVTEILRTDSWTLAAVQWDDGNGFSDVNAANLVALSDVAREARKVENDGAIPGLTIGSNAYTKVLS